MGTNPIYKKVDARVPEVTNSYVDRHFSWWRALSYPVVLFLLVIIVKAWIIPGFPIHSLAPAITTKLPIHSLTPIITAGPTPNTEIDCSNQSPPVLDGPPSLSFCSPEYLGSVAGPVGARIVLVGDNFSSLPTGWFLSMQSSNTFDALAHCSSNTLKDCLVLPVPSIIKQGSTDVFSWLWQAPLFPVEPGQYYIIAQVEGQVVTSSLSFTLLTSQPPCITVVATAAYPDITGQKPDCMQPQIVSLKQGALINIQGTNWLLGWPQGTSPLNIQVEITAHCGDPSFCGQSKLFDVIVGDSQLASSGTFSLIQPLPGDAVGTYVVSAWNKTMTTSIPGGSQNTIADHALTFGENTGDLILHIL